MTRIQGEISRVDVSSCIETIIKSAQHTGALIDSLVELTLAALAANNLVNEVIVVRDGEEALDYMYRRETYQLRPEGNPAVMLLDLKMPKINGLEVLEQIKTDDALKQIPVVMLTASEEESDLLRSSSSGSTPTWSSPSTSCSLSRRSSTWVCSGRSSTIRRRVV